LVHSSKKNQIRINIQIEEFTSRIAGYKAVVHSSIIVGKNCCVNLLFPGSLTSNDRNSRNLNIIKLCEWKTQSLSSLFHLEIAVWAFGFGSWRICRIFSLNKISF
jgi:hypothetical protein